MATKNTQQTTKRVSTSREQQRNAKTHAAYLSLREIGGVPGAPNLERFSVASQSQPGITYVVTHDIASDRYHCECDYCSKYGHSGCVHEMAARRRVDDRRCEMASYDLLYGDYTNY